MSQEFSVCVLTATSPAQGTHLIERTVLFLLANQRIISFKDYQKFKP